MNPSPPTRSGSRAGSRPQGELDRIVRELGQNLAQTRAIDEDRIERGRTRLRIEPQTLFIGLRPEQRHDLVHDLERVDGSGLEPEFLGVQARVVQDVGQDRQQGVG